jgi:hypothetical protein
MDLARQTRLGPLPETEDDVVSAGGSKSSSRAGQLQEASSFIDPSQLPFLKALWGSASESANPALAGAVAKGVAGRTMPGLGAAFGDIGALTDPSAQIKAQDASLKAGLGQMFREEINPAISGGAIGAGGFGGARQGVAQGVAAGQMGQAYAQGRGDIVARANQTALGAGSLMPTLAAAMQGQGQAPFVAEQDVLQRLAGILGGPTVVSKSRGDNYSSSSSAGWEFGLF